MTGRPGDEDDDRLNADMTAELHFGGGFIRKDTPTAAAGGDGDDGQGDPGRRRTKKEVCSHPLFISPLAPSAVPHPTIRGSGAHAGMAQGDAACALLNQVA